MAQHASPPAAVTPASSSQARYIAQLARELASTPCAVEASTALAGAGVNLDTTPRLKAIVAAGLTQEQAQALIGRLLRLLARARSPYRTGWQPKTSAQWDRLDHTARRVWLEGLTDRQLVAQAAVRARATEHSINRILVAWVLNGLLSYEHRLALDVALRGLEGISPAAFYDLCDTDPFRAGLALALLGSDGRYAFAAAYGELLGQIYGGPVVPADGVERLWRRAGLVEA